MPHEPLERAIREPLTTPAEYCFPCYLCRVVCVSSYQASSTVSAWHDNDDKVLDA